jgi:hypothetical protein
MSVDLLKEANPVSPEQTAGSVHEERAQRLLASILAEEPSRSFAERLSTLAPPRLVRTAAVVGAIAILALVFSVTFPFGDGSGGGGGKVKLTLLERAAAAMPDNGVDHMIIRKGRRVLDMWTESARKGHVVKNTLLGKGSGASYLGGIAGTSFVNLIGEYRKALENKKVIVVGRGRAFGRPVYWVRFRCSTTDAADLSTGFRCMERIALDQRSYLPVVEKSSVMTSSTGVPMRRHILKVEMISREQANFRPPAME